MYVARSWPAWGAHHLVSRLDSLEQVERDPRRNGPGAGFHRQRRQREVAQRAVEEGLGPRAGELIGGEAHRLQRAVDCERGAQRLGPRVVDVVVVKVDRCDARVEPAGTQDRKSVV